MTQQRPGQRIDRRQVDAACRKDAQAVEVKEDSSRQRKAGRVPWRERQILLLEHVDQPGKALRPVIQVLLIAELSVFGAAVAPLDAALLPPFAHRLRWPAHEGHELHAILAVVHRLVELRRVGVVRDQHRGARGLQLAEDGLWALHQPQVGVDIGHPRHRGVGFEDEARCEGRQRPAVLAFAARRLHGLQLGSLHLRQTDQRHVGKCQLREHVVRRLVHAQYPQTVCSRMALKRCVQRQPLRQEQAVEERDVVFHQRHALIASTTWAIASSSSCGWQGIDRHCAACASVCGSPCGSRHRSTKGCWWCIGTG